MINSAKQLCSRVLEAYMHFEKQSQHGCRSHLRTSCGQCNWVGVCMCVVTTETTQLWMGPSNLVEGQQKPSLLILYKSRPLMNRQLLVNLQLLWTRLSWHKFGTATCYSYPQITAALRHDWHDGINICAGLLHPPASYSYSQMGRHRCSQSD